ncbi:MAG: glycosyltransferase family 4 protein, partial [Nitrososphaera sp.]
MKKEGIESISLFTSSFLGAESEEVIDGVRVVRAGDKYSVYRQARKFYDRNQNSFDVVVDEINTKPFDTPSYVRDKPIIALVHQLAREFWFYETKFPINVIGYLFLENYWLRKYRELPTVTVSASTRDDLLKIGFNRVLIVPEGLGFKPLETIPEKEIVPTVLFVGRLKKAKKPDDAVRAFKIIKDEVPRAKFWIVGDGYMMNELKEMTYRLFGTPHQLERNAGMEKLRVSQEKARVSNQHHNNKSVLPPTFNSHGDAKLGSLETGEVVRFFGKVSSDEKLELMARAHVLLVPGVREGWGLVVTEANAMGTTVVAYDVPGLRDAVIDGVTGILVPNGDVVSMAIEAIELFKNEGKMQAFFTRALKAAKSFDWNNTSDHFAHILSQSVAERQENHEIRS